MFTMDSKYGEVVVFAKTIEQEAISQISKMANSPLGENAHIRIMPDAHAGAGCTIGTTMIITDKVCPNIVGVDIGCGVDVTKVNIDISERLDELDSVIHRYVPSGMNVHQGEIIDDSMLSEMYCWEELKKDTRKLALRSIGTLGGGNHFIEAYKDGYISVHSGSRNIGLNVAKYYQNLAEKRFEESRKDSLTDQLKDIEPKDRERYILARPIIKIEKDLMYLTGEDLENYLHDASIITKFAELNRKTILSEIARRMKLDVVSTITSTHNYIDKNTMILRKGAIAAIRGQSLVIPLNMRDGIMICTGNGNPDWNYSAPHGAGRLYSRSKAKEIFTVEEYEKSMDGIYTTCVNASTLDEAPFVYKDCAEIMEAVEPTVRVDEVLIPIYNFKAAS